MAVSLETALRFIASDERQFLEFLFMRQEIKETDQREISSVLERFIVTDMTDENGFLKPGALSDSEIARLQEELTKFYTVERLDEVFAETVGIIEARMLTIDDILRPLELESGILGSDVFEIEVVQEQVEKISQGLVRGAFGDEATDFTGSVERVERAMNDYRFNRDKPEFFKRRELMETLESDAGAGISHSSSVALTSMAQIDRQLRRVQADEAGITHGLYSGPFDGKIRPFCDKWLGQVETWEFWDNLSNDMPPGLFDKPASLMGGGINCRHRIMLWDLAWGDGKKDLRERFAFLFGQEIQQSRFDLSSLMLHC